MKQKLVRFTDFAENLFPHEVYYLKRVENFQTEDNKEILEVIQYNVEHRNKPKSFDESIDKRRYSNLKKWMEERLAEADVDQQLLAIQDLEARVLLDKVDRATEKQIERWFQKGEPEHYYFRKIYELAQHYEHFLLIRLREREAKKVAEYLNTYRADYATAQEVFNKLQQATGDIVDRYKKGSDKEVKWEDFLKDVVYNGVPDGMNTYAAFIRLSLLYLTLTKYQELDELYCYIDEAFKNGRFYSKRILANYYANKLLFLSRFSSLDEAEQFGYLSIKYKNADYLFYITNLSAVLLRQGKSTTALKLLREAFPEMRQTTSHHTRLGFIAFYIKCMIDIGRVQDAEQFADSFLKAYTKEVISGRWHLFFVSYFRSLILQEKYARLLYLAQRHKIEALDKANRSKPSYLPTISWYISVSRFIEGHSHADVLITEMQQAVAGIKYNESKKQKVMKILMELQPLAPKVLKSVGSSLF